MARELFVEQKKILRLGCYKEQKFAPNPKDPLPVQAANAAKQRCDFGFDSITPLCKNCCWFQIQEIQFDGRQAVSDRPINKADIPVLSREYASQDQAVADPQAAQRIAQEAAASLEKKT